MYHAYVSPTHLQPLAALRWLLPRVTELRCPEERAEYVLKRARQSMNSERARLGQSRRKPQGQSHEQALQRVQQREKARLERRLVGLASRLLRWEEEEAQARQRAQALELSREAREEAREVREQVREQAREAREAREQVREQAQREQALVREQAREEAWQLAQQALLLGQQVRERARQARQVQAQQMLAERAQQVQVLGQQAPKPAQVQGQQTLMEQAQQAQVLAQVEKLTLRRARNASGYVGVNLDRHRLGKPYQAKVTCGGKSVHLGYFATAEEAALCVARSPEGQLAAERAAEVERAGAALQLTSEQEEQLAAKRAADALRRKASRKRVREAAAAEAAAAEAQLWGLTPD